MNYQFPKDFLWGVAGSAFQMEGGMYEGGKGLNIREAAWLDPERRKNYQDDRSPEVSCDFYHKYPEDLALFRELGVKMFRFSIAWSRIFPDSGGKPCQAGIDYYNKMIDRMVELGIQPFFDLWHSDLPRWVLDLGGFPSEDFVSRYADYAETCFRAFGDRVKHWSTCNEPKLNTYGPYAFGRGAPYIKDLDLAMRATQNMILAHFEAVRRLRRLWPDAKIGSVNNTGECYCLSFEREDMDAAARHSAMQYLFSDPMILGEYPKEAMAYPGLRRHIPDEMCRELKEKFQPMDFLGCNYYCPGFVRAGNKSTYGTASFPVDLPKDAYPFYTYAPGLFDLLMNLKDRYDNLPVFITENGYADRREDVHNMDPAPFQHDVLRQNYIREHIRECGRALRAGVALQGYFYWSAMDCWEGTMGYGYPMGLVAVNFDTLERIPRDSFYYYQKIIRNNMVD